ncbi:MAG TPA: DinB family protein [Longimicrobiales bacterium]|nr:DinB family protein [Longimicrobiales bacterium]
MPLIAPILQEFTEEAGTTRRVLERVPDDRFDWKPHPKSRALGELAMHIAVVPGAIAKLATSPNPATMTPSGDATPTSGAELLAAHDESVATVNRVLEGISDATLLEPLRVLVGDVELFVLPRIVLIRSVMLNHWYHHRGQLSVYLRELDVPLPSIYGPTADENPFLPADA